jgi:hypothetical protein
MHLDSHASVSCFPEEWLPAVRRYLPTELPEVTFQTAAGQGKGVLAAGIRTVFTGDHDQDIME